MSKLPYAKYMFSKFKYDWNILHVLLLESLLLVIY